MKKRFFAVMMLAVLLAGTFGQLVFANTERFYTRNNILFLDTDGSLDSEVCSELTGSGSAGESLSAGELSKDLMEIKDADKLASAIDEWVKQKTPNSPFVGLGKYAVMGGQRSGINPILPIIIARKESQLGTASAAGRKLTEGHNAFGRTATAGQPHVATGRLWYKWNSFEDSLFDKSSRKDDMYAYLKRQYSSTKTIDELMLKYAPPSENDTTTYINQIKQWAGEIYALAGDAIDRAKLGLTNSYDDCAYGSDSYSGGAAGMVSLGDFNMFYQHQGAWAKQLIGKGGCVNKDFAWCGCGPTSLAIVVSNLTGDKSVNPLKTRDLSQFASAGISWSSFTSVPKAFGLKSQMIGVNIAKVRETLQAGGLVIFSQSRGALTGYTDGHIMVIRGMTEDGKFLVADPFKPAHTNNQNGFTAAQILGGTRNMWAVTK